MVDGAAVAPSGSGAADGDRLGSRLGVTDGELLGKDEGVSLGSRLGVNTTG
jgi:hypothetical protein